MLGIGILVIIIIALGIHGPKVIIKGALWFLCISAIMAFLFMMALKGCASMLGL